MKKYIFPTSIMIIAGLLSFPLFALAAEQAKDSKAPNADNAEMVKQGDPAPAKAEHMAAEERIDSATRLLKEGVAISNSIPAPVMEKAVGIAIIPEWTKAALIAGGSYGSGVLSAKQKDGHWSNPLFVSLTGGSFGAQAGFKSSELILVFTHPGALDQLAKNEEFTLGMEAGVTAGDMKKSTSADMTDAQIWTYEKSSGLFAGASLDGTVLRVQRSPTLAYYSLSDNPEEARGYFGKENADASLYSQIIDANERRPTMNSAVVPDSAKKFKDAVDEFVSSVKERSKQ